jgi:hypothetical protein
METLRYFDLLIHNTLQAYILSFFLIYPPLIQHILCGILKKRRFDQFCDQIYDYAEICLEVISIT